MKKLAIVGSGSTRNQAPYQDQSYEIWGTGTTATHRDVERLTCIIELHDKEVYQNYQNAFIDFNGPIYTKTFDTHLKNCLLFPMIEVLKEYPAPYDCTISYMIALAMLQGFDLIELYGVHLNASDEYMKQKTSVAFMVGFARGQGVEVVIADGSPFLMSGDNYIYREQFNNVLLERKRELTEKAQNILNQKARIEQELLIVQGALSNNEELLRGV